VGDPSSGLLAQGRRGPTVDPAGVADQLGHVPLGTSRNVHVVALAELLDEQRTFCAQVSEIVRRAEGHIMVLPDRAASGEPRPVVPSIARDGRT
jgi:hypothetical protein